MGSPFKGKVMRDRGILLTIHSVTLRRSSYNLVKQKLKNMNRRYLKRTYYAFQSREPIPLIFIIHILEDRRTRVGGGGGGRDLLCIPGEYLEQIHCGVDSSIFPIPTGYTRRFAADFSLIAGHSLLDILIFRLIDATG